MQLVSVLERYTDLHMLIANVMATELCYIVHHRTVGMHMCILRKGNICLS